MGSVGGPHEHAMAESFSASLDCELRGRRVLRSKGGLPVHRRGTCPGASALPPRVPLALRLKCEPRERLRPALASTHPLAPSFPLGLSSGRLSFLRRGAFRLPGKRASRVSTVPRCSPVHWGGGLQPGIRPEDQRPKAHPADKSQPPGGSATPPRRLIPAKSASSGLGHYIPTNSRGEGPGPVSFPAY